MTSLRRERELLITKQQAGGSNDAQRLRVLSRENAQVHLKMKGLLAELEEVRAQNEHQGLQSDHVTRLQLKQLSESTASLKASEVRRVVSGHSECLVENGSWLGMIAVKHRCAMICVN